MLKQNEYILGQKKILQIFWRVYGTRWNYIAYFLWDTLSFIQAIMMMIRDSGNSGCTVVTRILKMIQCKLGWLVWATTEIFQKKNIRSLVCKMYMRRVGRKRKEVGDCFYFGFLATCGCFGTSLQ